MGGFSARGRFPAAERRGAAGADLPSSAPHLPGMNICAEGGTINFRERHLRRAIPWRKKSPISPTAYRQRELPPREARNATPF